MRITSLTLPSIHHDTSLNFKKLEGNAIIRAVDVPAGGASGFTAACGKSWAGSPDMQSSATPVKVSNVHMHSNLVSSTRLVGNYEAREHSWGNWG